MTSPQLSSSSFIEKAVDGTNDLVQFGNLEFLGILWSRREKDEGYPRNVGIVAFSSRTDSMLVCFVELQRHKVNVTSRRTDRHRFLGPISSKLNVPLRSKCQHKDVRPIRVLVPINVVMWVSKAIAKDVPNLAIKAFGNLVAKLIDQCQSFVAMDFLVGTLEMIGVLHQFFATNVWTEIPRHFGVVVECGKGVVSILCRHKIIPKVDATGLLLGLA